MSLIQEYIQHYLFMIPVILISLPFHEFAHAYTATKLGDTTPKREGRLTLNPIAHLDPIGFICLFIIGFGWAKPVMVNPNMMKNRKAGMALTSVAGPLSNVLLAFFFAGIYKILTVTLVQSSTILDAVVILLLYFVNINIGLAIFNLIPIPPLDGSRILAFFLPTNLEAKLYQYERYLYVAIIILLFTGILTTPLRFVINAALTAMSFIFNLNMHLFY